MFFTVSLKGLREPFKAQSLNKYGYYRAGTSKGATNKHLVQKRPIAPPHRSMAPCVTFLLYMRFKRDQCCESSKKVTPPAPQTDGRAIADQYKVDFLPCISKRANFRYVWFFEQFPRTAVTQITEFGQISRTGDTAAAHPIMRLWNSEGAGMWGDALGGLRRARCAMAPPKAQTVGRRLGAHDAATDGRHGAASIGKNIKGAALPAGAA